MNDATKTLKPGLYVTATPIGNLGDITYRAVETLKAADLILCEDTRQTAKLCAAYGIETPRSAYHDHNAARMRPEIMKKLQEGAAICLVSDAGTPLISDPGYKLAREARDAGVDVIPIPGPSAVIAAISAAGLPSDIFTFAGFLPAKKGAREKSLQALAETPGTLVFYESGPRLSESLAAMAKILGDRLAVVARELTKIHEEFKEDTLSALSAAYEAAPPKGEIVVLVAPAEEKEIGEEDLDAFLHSLPSDVSVKDAAKKAAEALGVSRNDAYARAMRLKENR